MNTDITRKSLAVFLLALVGLYFAVFYGCEYWRQHKGPWEVHFNSDASGRPSVVIYQPNLGISSVEILLMEEPIGRTNLSEKVVFDHPLQPIPFGRTIYEDLITLPGVVTFDLFGHELELLPRVLIADKREIPWKTERVVELTGTNKPAQRPQPPKGYLHRSGEAE